MTISIDFVCSFRSYRQIRYRQSKIVTKPAPTGFVKRLRFRLSSDNHGPTVKLIALAIRCPKYTPCFSSELLYSHAVIPRHPSFDSPSSLPRPLPPLVWIKLALSVPRITAARSAPNSIVPTSSPEVSLVSLPQLDRFQAHAMGSLNKSLFEQHGMPPMG